MVHELGIFIKNNKLIRYRIRREHVVERNISHLLIQHLSCYCCIERSTTLRDIFRLCNPHCDMLDEIFPHCHISEFIKYGLNSKQLEKFNSDTNLIVIRIHQNSYKDCYDTCIVGEDDTDKNKLTYYSPIATDVADIIDYEVLVKNDFLYSSEYYNDLPENQFVETITNIEIRIFDLIYSLFYEFSWFGGPKQSKNYWNRFYNNMLNDYN